MWFVYLCYWEQFKWRVLEWRTFKLTCQNLTLHLKLAFIFLFLMYPSSNNEEEFFIFLTDFFSGELHNLAVNRQFWVEWGNTGTAHLRCDLDSFILPSISLTVLGCLQIFSATVVIFQSANGYFIWKNVWSLNSNQLHNFQVLLSLNVRAYLLSL